MPSKYFSGIRRKIIKSVGKLFLNSSIHPYAHCFLNIIQWVQVLAIILEMHLVDLSRRQIIENSTLQVVILILLVFQGALIMMAAIMVAFQKDQENENVHILEHQPHLLKMIEKALSTMLTVYRKIIVMPIFTLCYTTLFGGFQSGNIASTLALVNLIITVGIVYPLAGIIFCNKITFYSNIMSYSYKVNIESLLYLYMPIYIFLCIYQSSIVTYTSLMFSAFYFAIMFIRPIVMYRQNKIAIFWNSSVFSFIFVESFLALLKVQMNTATDIFLFILISFIFTVVLYQYQIKRIKRILLSEQQNNLFSKITHCNFNEILFYHIVNYETQSSSLLLFLIAFNQKNHQKNSNSKIKQWSQNKLFLAKRKCEKTIKSIIKELKTKNMQSKQLQRLFSEFLLNYFNCFYNPHHFSDQNLGIKELHEKITNFQGFSIIISHILVLESSNLRKCYTFMRLHQKLLKKIDNLGFIESIEIYASIVIIQEDLKVKGKTSEQYSTKAEKYFVFEQFYESLKNTILESCENRVTFWQEHHQQEINCQKLKLMIHKNFTLSKKIEMLCSKIIKDFPNKSPIILFELIASYSAQILNKKIYSTLNPFNSLVKKYKEELQIQKKEGALIVDNGLIKNFSLLQNIGTCMIDLEHNLGKIEWGNQYFWLEFYQSFISNQSNKTNNQNDVNSQQDAFIFNLMVPQLKNRHFGYFKEFSQSSLLNQNHQVAFLYQQFRKIFQRVHIEIQIFPSLSKGLKVTTFMLKCNFWDQNTFQKSAVLINQDFSILGFTKEFICLKSSLAQNQNNSLQLKNGETLYLCQELIESETFVKVLQKELSSKEHKNEIEVKIGHQMFLVSLIKVYMNSENNDRSIIEHVVEKASKRSLSNKIYLLEITPMEGAKKQLNLAQTKDQNMHKQKNVLAKTSSQSTNHHEMKSQNSINTSQNSNNIDRAVSLIPDVEKQEDQYNEDKNKKSDEILNIQKKYRDLMFNKKSKKIKYWIYFTFLIIVVLISAMVVNMVVFKERQTLFEENRLKIKYFYQIMTDIGQIIISLRQYNYYVYMDGPTNPHVPFLIEKIKNQENQVNFKLKFVAKQMDEIWPAIQIKNDLTYYLVNQQDFIVTANYMLSAMTFISQIQPDQINFPIFFSKIDPSTINPTIFNFNQAIYNGIYVVLNKMAAKRPRILAGVLNHFNQFHQKYYFYPCIGGILLLFVFSIVSIRIEIKSQSIRLKTVELLSKVNTSLKKEKVNRAIEFKQSNIFMDLEPKKHNKRNSAVTYMAETLHTLMDPGKNLDFMKMLTKGRDGQQRTNNALSIEIKSSEPETENETKRDLFRNTNQDLEAAQIDQSVQKKINKDIKPDIEEQPYRNIDLPSQKAQRFKILFYALVIAPTLIYFIITMVGGAKIDCNMISNFELAAQIYIQKTNEELALLTTRETFYFEPFLTFDFSWTQNVITDIEKSLHHYRKLQKLIYQNPNAKSLRALVQELKNGNLCNQLQKLKKSQYMEVKFTQQECQSFQQGILTKGLKQTQTWYYSTAMFILSNITDTSVLTYEDRVKYLQMPEFTSMKIMLAYAQQFSDMIADAFQKDFDDYSQSFKGQNIIYSVLSILGLGLLILGIMYRWGFVNRQRKEIISILDLVSLESIKYHPELNKLFQDIELNFYK